MIKRIIFDLDRTLIPWLDEWDDMVEKTYNYFNIPFEEDEFIKFNKAMLDYEKHHRRFDKKDMSLYFRNTLGKEIPDMFLEVWTGYLSECVPKKDKKLIELLEYLIKTYSNEGDTILDNTMGSGSTGVACKNTNRNFLGIEINEKYFNIAKERILS